MKSYYCTRCKEAITPLVGCCVCRVWSISIYFISFDNIRSITDFPSMQTIFFFLTRNLHLIVVKKYCFQSETPCITLSFYGLLCLLRFICFVQLSAHFFLFFFFHLSSLVAVSENLIFADQNARITQWVVDAVVVIKVGCRGKFVPKVCQSNNIIRISRIIVCEINCEKYR